MRVALAEQRIGDRIVRTVGAGRTRREARARACTEMIERMSGFFVGTEPRVRATQRVLGDAAIPANDVLLFSRRQLQVPRGDRDDQRLQDWSPLLDATSAQVRFLPTDLLYYGLDASTRRLADSNGVAAGRGVADAACRALLELIERDSVALWWYNRVRRPRVAVARVPDPFVRRMLAWHGAMGRKCWALDLTSDLGVPVTAAISALDHPARQQIVFGFGASFDATEALRHALLEAGQMLALTRVASDDLRLPRPMRAWLREATVATREHLLPRDGRARTVRPDPRPDAATTFHALRRRLARHGLSTLLLDLSRAKYRTAVVRVVVPGLRPWWPRFAPGRLYDAPVAAGWQSRVKREAEMNAEPIFF